jgi:hypothetical protein
MKKRFASVLILLLSLTALWLSGHPPSAELQGAAELDLTDRILLTLANSLSEDYQYGPRDLPDIKERPDFLIDEETGEEGLGRGSYAYSFRSEVGNFASSGYFKIAALSHYRAPKEEEGWGRLNSDDATGADIWFRKVRPSEVVSYNEVEVTAAKGNLGLTVSFRRPLGEPAEDARRIALEAFLRLIENARKNGLLFRILAEWIGDGAAEQLEENALLNIRGRENEETRVRLRIKAVDHLGTPLANVEMYAVTLKGFLGRHARIEGASFNREKGRYEIHDPPEDGARVLVVFPALDDAEFAAALDQDGGLRSDFGIVLDVDVMFKPAEGR